MPTPSESRSDLWPRVLSAAIAAPLVLLPLFWGPPWVFLVVLAAATCMTAIEFYRMTLPEEPFLQALGVATTLALAGAFTSNAPARVLLAVVLVALLAIATAAVLRPDPVAHAGERIGWLGGGALYIGAPLAALARLHLEPPHGRFVLLAMTIAWASDTAAYFVGRACGRHKLHPEVSPNKSWEGALAGLLGSVLATGVASVTYLPRLSMVGAALLGLGAGALGQIGDLTESLIKRHQNVKDSGALMPGHGGLLDRIDALLFVAVGTWLFLEWAL